MKQVRRNWGWFLALGIALILLGVTALVAVGLTTLATVLFIGWLVLFGGVFEVGRGLLGPAVEWVLSASAHRRSLCRRWRAHVGHPVAAAAGLTLVLSALFLTGGVFRIVAAAMLRYPNWGWSVLDGIVSLILGVMIWAEWPSSALWVIGTFVGIILFFAAGRG